MEEFTALITDERRRFNATSAIYNGLKDGEDPIQLIVQCEADEITIGQNYRVTGTWKFSARWGHQFQVHEFIEAVPMSRSAVIYYLSKLPGIGPRTAAKIYDHFGENTLDQIMESPEYLTQLPRINYTKAQAIANLIRGDIEMVQTKVELQAYLQGSGFPRNLAEKLYRRYGAVVIRIIQRNPYLLLAYDGCGFQRVDQFALKNGFNPMRVKRQALFLLYTMDQAQDQWFPLPELNLALYTQFGAGAKPEKTLRLLRRAGRLAATRIAPDGTQLYEWQLAKQEDEDTETLISTDVVQRVGRANFPVMIDTTSLTDSQKEAIRIATAKHIGCFTGGPGTGKTYTVARYIQGICKQYGEESILVVAPTGKAVVRSREMLATIGVKCDSSTIHSYLMGSAKYYRFIVCDEASMIDAKLMRDLLRATRDSSLLFVGDDGQLLPVGKGRPFADFIASGVVPVGKLTQTMRNSGRIVQACHQIRRNAPWDCSPELNLKTGENLIMVKTDDFLKATLTIAEQWKGVIDPIRDMQVIVGTNQGNYGREEMNTQLQKNLNPGEGKYHVGDPVICLKNAMYRDAESNLETVYLTNGEIGYCVETFPNLVIDFGTDKQVRISEKSLLFDLAYAVTCHKMQGSETPIGVVLLDPSYQAKMVCTREWLYTAISRAKKVCYLIGDKQTANSYCQKLGNSRRTLLTQAIIGAYHE